MTALNRAFAFAEMDDIAMGVAEYLNLNMTWALDCLLQIKRIVTKAPQLPTFACRKLSAVRQAVATSPSLAAAAGRSL